MPAKATKGKPINSDKFFVNGPSKKEIGLFDTALLDHCEYYDLRASAIKMTQKLTEEVLWSLSKLDVRWAGIFSHGSKDTVPRYQAFHKWLKDALKDKKRLQDWLDSNLKEISAAVS
jgi:hypothetical protein